MKTSKWRVVGGVLAVAILVFGAVSVLAQTTWYVPDGGSIQVAIDAASAGDTINVAAGTYAGNLTIPAGMNNLQIVGAGNTNTHVTITTDTAFYTYSPVTIKGFHIQGPARGTGTALQIRASGSGCPSSASGTETTPGVFEDNKVDNLNYGVQLHDHCNEYWEIKSNEFSEIRIGVGLQNSRHFKVTGNTFDDYKEGVSMGWGNDCAFDIEIKNNQFLGSGGQPDDLAAIVLSSATHDVTVSGNGITASIIGVLVKNRDGDNTPNLANVAVENNNISGNTDGIVNDHVGTTLLAENNWWGHASGPSGQGPGSGDAVSTNVDFCPWLDAGYPGGNPAGPVMNVSTGTAYCTIQDAVNAATAGDIINVAAGTYNEDVTVNKSLTLSGAQAGVDARGRSASESEIVGVVVVTSAAANVVFDGFKFTSPTRAFTPRGFNLRIESESSTVTNNIFVAEENAGHTYSGYLDFEGITNATVTENSFSGHLDLAQYPNVVRLGISGAGTVTVADNEMHDVGGGGGIGIMCGNAAAVVNIDGNEIKNTGNECIWVWNGGGSAFDALSITSNDLSEATKNGIKFEAPVTGTVSISGNEFRDNPVQVLDKAEVLDIQDVLNANNFDRAVVVNHEGASLLHIIWSKIQDAVNAAVSGDTILVAAGTYDEYLVIQKSIHLIGEDKNTTILTYTGAPTVEQLIMLGWNTGGTLAGGATVQGFKLLADEGLYGDKDLIKLRANGVSGAPIVIKDNIFQGDGVTRYVGIETAYDAGHVEVENNEFDDLAYGAWFNVLINAEIKGNTITDAIWSALAVNTSDLNQTHDIDILDNTILRTGVGAGSPTWSAGLHLGSTIYNVQVTGNTIADGYDYGVYVMDRGAIAMTNVHINNNNIHNNALGFENELKLLVTPVIVDATNNWWGDPTGPYHPTSWIYDSQVITNPDGKGDEVSDYVLYDPWYRPTTPMASFVVDHAKIDFKKKQNDDEVHVRGELAPASDVAISQDVTVTVGPLSQTIKMEAKGKNGDQWEYKRPKGGEGDIKHMTIDWKNGRFDIRMDKADLAGVTNPVFISIQIGDDVGSESILMREKKHHWDYKANKPKAIEIDPFAIRDELEVVAYPNPIRDVHTATFQVMGTLAAEVEEIRVQIFDLSGHLVWEDAALGSELDWHTNSLSGDYLANGIYLYRVEVRIDGNWISQDVGKIAVLR